MKQNLTSIFDFIYDQKPPLLTFAIAKARVNFDHGQSNAVGKDEIQKLVFQKQIMNNDLQSRSTITGFKKVIYNRVKFIKNQLYPSINRRKYAITHYNQIVKTWTSLSRSYAYLSKQKGKSFLAFSLVNKQKIDDYNRNHVKMIQLLESQLCVLMHRSLFSKSIPMARFELRKPAKDRKSVV